MIAAPTAMPIWIAIRAYGASRIRSISPLPPRSCEAAPATAAEPGSQPPKVDTCGWNSDVAPRRPVRSAWRRVQPERPQRGGEVGDRRGEPVQQDAVVRGDPRPRSLVVEQRR